MLPKLVFATTSIIPAGLAAVNVAEAARYSILGLGPLPTSWLSVRLTTWYNKNGPTRNRARGAYAVWYCNIWMCAWK